MIGNRSDLQKYCLSYADVYRNLIDAFIGFSHVYDAPEKAIPFVKTNQETHNGYVLYRSEVNFPAWIIEHMKKIRSVGDIAPVVAYADTASYAEHLACEMLINKYFDGFSGVTQWHKLLHMHMFLNAASLVTDVEKRLQLDRMQDHIALQIRQVPDNPKAFSVVSRSIACFNVIFTHNSNNPREILDVFLASYEK